MELDDYYPWPKGKTNEAVNPWETPQPKGRSSTEDDYDMEGPYKPFVPKNFTPPNNRTETSLKAIRATGNPTRARINQAIKVQASA